MLSACQPFLKSQYHLHSEDLLLQLSLQLLASQLFFSHGDIWSMNQTEFNHTLSKSYDSHKLVVSEMNAIQFGWGGRRIIVSTSHATKLCHVNRSYALCNGIPIPDSRKFLLIESGIFFLLHLHLIETAYIVKIRLTHMASIYANLLENKKRVQIPQEWPQGAEELFVTSIVVKFYRW